jgi:hypothetical protein
MRIEILSRSEERGRPRISARIVWEHARREPALLWLETEQAFADALSPSPDAFLLATFPLAVLARERRITVEGPVCSTLRDGLETVMRNYNRWNRRWRPVPIEPSDGFRDADAPRDSNVACLMSGGVDALAMLRENRLHHDIDNPESIRDGLVIFGLNTHDFRADGRPDPERVLTFERHVRRLDRFAERVSITMIPLRTNLRTMYADFSAWGHGWTAGTIWVGVALETRINQLWFASAGRAESVSNVRGLQIPLSPLFSTGRLRVHLGQPDTTRLDKVRMLADWPPALDVVRSCTLHRIPPDESINCGRCEKCVRTMLELLAAGALHRSNAFPYDALTPSMLSVLRNPDPFLAPALIPMYEDLIEPLRAGGHHELLPPLEAALAECRLAVQRGGRGWIGALSRRLRAWSGSSG